MPTDSSSIGRDHDESTVWKGHVRISVLGHVLAHRICTALRPGDGVARPDRGMPGNRGAYSYDPIVSLKEKQESTADTSYIHIALSASPSIEYCKNFEKRWIASSSM